MTGESADPETLARVTLRPIGSPLPLGMLALAVATFTLSGLQLSWISAAQSREAGLAVLVFAVPLQLLSCVFGFLARDPAAGTGMALQAGGWFAIGTLTYTGVPGRPSGGLGLVLVAAGTTLLVPVAAAAYSKVLASAVMGLTALRFWLTGAYELSGSAGVKTAAGIAGLVLAAAALYAGLAFELEDSRRRTLLPTVRRGAGRTALAGLLVRGDRRRAARSGSAPHPLTVCPARCLLPGWVHGPVTPPRLLAGLVGRVGRGVPPGHDAARVPDVDAAADIAGRPVDPPVLP